MLSSHINQSHSFRKISPLHKPFLATVDATHHSSSSAYSPAILRQPTTTKKSNATRARRTSAGKIKGIKFSFSTSTKVSGTIDTKLSYLFNLTPSYLIDDVTSFMWSSLKLTFVSKDLDSNGNLKTLETKAKYDTWAGQYNFQFEVPEDFGEIGDIGAVLVENDYRNAIYIEKIAVSKKVTFTCNSWVHSNSDNSNKRIFFADKCYLPSQTPEALKLLRAKDLESFRGNGTGERKPFERIYDYDVYNDLGSPDKSSDLSRPVLGGEKHPYPRRCRTGRKMSSKVTKVLYNGCSEEVIDVRLFLGLPFHRTQVFNGRVTCFLFKYLDLDDVSVFLNRRMARQA